MNALHAIYAKEFRPLLLPFFAVLSATVLSGFLEPTLEVAFSPILFAGGCAFLGSLAFGLEWQQRTFPLLLSQPVPRFDLWRWKTAVTFSTVLASAACFLPLMAFSEPGLERMPVFMGAVSALLTASSVGYWTLVARSALGGTVFTVGSQLLLLLLGATLFDAIGRFYARLSPGSPPLGESGFFLLVALLVVCYCASFLGLGWKKFSSLQAADPAPGNVVSSTGVAPGRGFFPWLPIRPSASWRNLLAKDLMLQKQVFTLGLVFAASWLALMLARRFSPQWFTQELCVAIAGGHMVLAALLAGCLSLAEENVLGTREWHRTLPVSWVKQWLLKWTVPLGVTLVVAGLLPWAALAGSFWLDDHPLSWKDAGTLVMQSGMLCAVAFVLGTWASSFFSSTVRAAAGALGMITGLAVAAALGWSFGYRAGDHIESLFVWPLAALQAFSTDLGPWLGGRELLNAVALGAVVVVTALFQSRQFFRPPAPSFKGVILAHLLLAVMIYLFLAYGMERTFPVHIALLPALLHYALSRLPSFRFSMGQPLSAALRFLFIMFAAAFFLSLANMGLRGVLASRLPEAGVETALGSLRLPRPAQPVRRTITIDELEKVGDLPAYGRLWLRNAQIEWRSAPNTMGEFTVSLPDGRTHVVSDDGTAIHYGNAH